jgi:hypothetical protein
MLLTVDQIKMLYLVLDKYPNAQYVFIRDEDNGTAIGPSTLAEFQDRGNLLRKIAPKVVGKEDITDVNLW